MFADDTTTFDTRCVLSCQPCCAVSTAIDDCQLWPSNNNAGFNAAKSAEMFFSSAQQKVVPVQYVSLDRDVIPRVASHKHLGVVIDEHLSWSSHVCMVINKVQPKVYLLMSLTFRTPLSSFALFKFYTTLIRPHLEYCIGLDELCEICL